jgi:DUF971 family protein
MSFPIIADEVAGESGRRRRRPANVRAPAYAYNPHVTDASTTASRIHADRAAGTLQIGWADGHETSYDAVTMRWLCPCAFCRGEAGLPGWLDSRPTLTAEQTRLVDVQLVGQYAIAPTWGDGHHTGYYTFALLRDRCPCDACTARRVQEGGSTAARSPTHAEHAGHGDGAGHAGHSNSHSPGHGNRTDTVTSPSKEHRP